MPMTRWKAAAIHLGLSAILYIVLLYLIVFFWYPQPYFAADGGWDGVNLITGVDLVLGPMLTLIVFKAGKRGLRYDLTLIGIVQTVALILGIGIVYDQRIAMVVYAEGSFYTLTHDQVRDAGGQATEVLARANTTPPYGFVHLPTEKRERTKFWRELLRTGMPMLRLGDRYEPLDTSNLEEVLKHGVDLEQYTTRSEQNRQELERFLNRHGGKTEDYAFLPLVCRYSELFLALRRPDGGVIDSLKINKRPPAATKPPDAAAVQPSTANELK
jgi:hypothetical protein